MELLDRVWWSDFVVPSLEISGRCYRRTDGSEFQICVCMSLVVICNRYFAKKIRHNFILLRGETSWITSTTEELELSVYDKRLSNILFRKTYE